MNDPTSPEINVEALMARLRQQTAGSRGKPAESARPARSAEPQEPAMEFFTDEVMVHLPKLPEPASLEAKDVYQLHELLDYHDEAFVANAYRGVLKREPDAVGLEHFLHALRSGRQSKIGILGVLRYSPEGKAIGTRIKGLWAPYTLSRLCALPILGYVISLLVTILQLPAMVRNTRTFEAYMTSLVAHNYGLFNQAMTTLEQQLPVKLERADAERFHRQIEAILAHKAAKQDVLSLEQALKRQLADKVEQTTAYSLVQGLVERLNLKADLERVGALETQLGTKADAAQLPALETAIEALRLTKADNPGVLTLIQRLNELEHDKHRLTEQQRSLEELQDRLQAQIHDHQRSLIDHKRNIIEQQRRLTLLLAQASKGAAGLAAPEASMAVRQEAAHLLDALYVTFEDQFRGTREDIKQRAQAYLPLIRAAGAGRPGGQVLDLGCGRGEWLELLKERGLRGSGIDLNRTMVSQCRELGLAVTEAEAIAYLRGLEPNSLEAITGMHIIEHFPHEDVIALFREAFRIIKPGGVAIFETPNPENLIVGSFGFYHDPTHRNPLPPEVAQFSMEASGFDRTEILRMSEHRIIDPLKLLDESVDGAVEVNALISLVRRFFCAAPDYAVIGYKY